jgi:kynurenine formamidase
VVPRTIAAAVARRHAEMPMSVTPIERIVDLSVVLDGSTQVYPGDPQPRLSVATRIESHGFNLLHVAMGSQSGTHVDSPYHFKNDAPRLEDCDLGLFLGAGVVIDLRGKAPRERITVNDIESYETPLRAGAIAILYTGWSDLHYGTNSYFDHPFLDAAACERMLAWGVRTFAIDAINIDETILDERDPDFSCHHLIAARAGIIAENLRNVGAIDFDDPLISMLPIRFGGEADGAPCRVVAVKLNS